MKLDYIKGADLSFVDEIETEGGAFFEGNEKKDVFAILKDAGVNSVRLRIWNNPTGGYCNLERTKLIAKRIKEYGMHFLLDFHYSDYWADPGKQTKPKEWENLSFPELVEAVHTYTKQVITELKVQDTLPDMVQIGNEITPGMLWNEGRVDGEFNTVEQWENFAQLVKSGINGVKASLDENDQVDIMIHIDRGGDNATSQKFFDRFKELNVEFDIIGQSFYPWWHGTLQDLEENLEDLATRYDKDIIVVEIAYPWTLEPPREYIFNSEEQLLPGYPATVEGQKKYLSDLMKLVKNTPNDRGKGVYYWEPCWIPSKEEWSVGHANNWSNLTLFDFNGKKLDSLNVFKEKF